MNSKLTQCQCNCKDEFDYHGCVHIDVNAELEEYFPSNLLSLLKLKEVEGVKPPEDYLQRIIFNYMHNIDEEINVDEVISRLKNNDKQSFYYTPVILYILHKRYDKYFIKQEQL